jgi:hypothetical protein
MKERGVHCSIVEVVPVHDKKSRAQSVSARVAMGMVYFPKFAPWWMEARQELLQFPFGVRDDFVDALAWVGIGLSAYAPRKPKQQAKPPPQTLTLGWVKDAQIREKRRKAGAAGQGW